jgi:DNA-binding response OmpR family regulator
MHSPNKILCIEDDRENRAQIAKALADLGFAVSVAPDGQDGLLAILKDRPDLCCATWACRECPASKCCKA